VAPPPLAYQSWAAVCLIRGTTYLAILIWPSLVAADVTDARFGLGVLLVQIACLGWQSVVALEENLSSTGTLPAAALQQLFAGLMLMAVGRALGEERLVRRASRDGS
jgi:hypothetical protein